MKLQWFKLLLTSLKKVKKRVWVVFSLIIGLIIGWNTVLSEYDRWSILARLGSTEAKIAIGDYKNKYYTNSYYTNNGCIGNNSYAGISSVLNAYFDAISSKEAQLNVLELFNRQCFFTSHSDTKRWRDPIVSYISRYFKDNITQIESWITNEYSLEAVIRFYFYGTYKHDYSYLGKDLINRKIDECVGTERVKCLETLAGIVARLEDVSSRNKWQSIALNLYELLLKEDLDVEKIDYYQFSKAELLLSDKSTSAQGRAILNELAERDFVPALVVIGKEELNGNLDLGKEYLSRALDFCPYKCDLETNNPLFFTFAYSSAFNEERKSNYFNEILITIGEKSCFPTDLQCYRTLANLYMKQKLYGKAMNIFDQIFDYNTNKKGTSIVSDAGADAAIQLGNIYYQGLGLKQDLEEAKKYYGMACDYKSNDNQEACDLYREVNEKLH